MENKKVMIDVVHLSRAERRARGLYVGQFLTSYQDDDVTVVVRVGDNSQLRDQVNVPSVPPAKGKGKSVPWAIPYLTASLLMRAGVLGFNNAQVTGA